MWQESTPPPALAKGKKGKGKTGAVPEPRQRERQSCPCDATQRPYSPAPQGVSQLGAPVSVDGDAAAAGESGPSVEIAHSPRQRLCGEARFQHSALPVTDEVQRFLEALGASVAEEDKRAAAALLLARRRRPSRHERHSV